MIRKILSTIFAWPWYAQLPMALLVLCCVCALFALVVGSAQSTAQYWSPAFSVALVIMLFLYPHICKAFDQSKQRKQQLIDQQREVAASFFQKFFLTHRVLPIEIEKLNGKGEYLTRLTQYSYDDKTTLYTLMLYDYSDADIPDLRKLRIFSETLQSAVFDFFSTGEYVSPSAIPPIFILSVDYSEEDYAYFVRFTFCYSAKTYEKARSIKAVFDSRRMK